MGDWQSTTVGELCASGAAQIQTGPFGSQLHAHEYVEDGVPVVPTEAIRDRRIDHTVLPKISNEKAAALQRHRLRPDDILFARRGVQATGRSAIVRDHEAGFVCGTGAIRLRLELPASPVLPEFLSLILSDRVSIEWFKFHAIGATMPNLNEGIIKSFSFAAPPVAEQVAITSILGVLDDKIDLNRRMNETLEAMARAIFKDWFVDFGPTRAKMEGRPPYLAPDFWALFPDRLDDEGKPEGWKFSSIGSEVKVLGGSTPSTTNPAYWDGTISWATPKDLSRLSSPVLTHTERQITEQGLTQIGSGLLPSGTLLLSSRAPIGYLAISQVPVAVNQGFIAMVCDGRLSNVFCWLWSFFNIEEIKQRANGSTFLEISKANFRPIPVIMPSDDLLRAFDRMVGPLYSRLAQNVHESRTLESTRDLLLPKLMSGEVRVRDAENLLGAVA